MRASRTVYIFDVDGTLTPARQPIRAGYRRPLKRWMGQRVVYLITGSDVSKLREQIDTDILVAAAGYFTCAGSEHWAGEHRLSHRRHDFPPAVFEMLNELLSESPYPRRFGNHIEERTGMINFSIVGRNASLAERKAYFAWDREHGERLDFATRLGAAFPAYDFAAGGEISIDIVPSGGGKAQILSHLITAHPDALFVFYGNRMGPQGNDRPLADALARLGPQHRAIEVRDDAETFRMLLEQVG